MDEYARDGQRTYHLAMVTVEGDESKFHELFAAQDTTRVWREGKVELAEVKKIELRDLNGDGLEDISVSVTYGTFEMDARRMQLCMEAEEARIQSDGSRGRSFRSRW